MQSSGAGLRVAVAVARNIRDIRMEGPFLQDPFLTEAVSLQKPRRGFVLEIANGPNAKDGGVRKGPFGYRGHCFAHETLSPIRTSEKIPQIDSLILARRDGANQFLAIAAKDQPGKRFA